MSKSPQDLDKMLTTLKSGLAELLGADPSQPLRLTDPLTNYYEDSLDYLDFSMKLEDHYRVDRATLPLFVGDVVYLVADANRSYRSLKAHSLVQEYLVWRVQQPKPDSPDVMVI